MKRKVINFLSVFLFVLSPVLLWADVVIVPSNDPNAGASFKKKTSKTHTRKHTSKKRRKKSSKVGQGTSAAQEEVTDQREVSQQANSSDKHLNSKK